MTVAPRRDQTPGWTSGHFSHEHGSADHEQDTRGTGNHVKRDLLGAQHLVARSCWCVVCHLNLTDTQCIGAIQRGVDRLQRRCIKRRDQPPCA